MGGSQGQYLKVKGFVIDQKCNIRNHINKREIYLRQVFKQNLTAYFVDLIYRRGLEKQTLYIDKTFNEMFLPCRVPIFSGQKVAVTRVTRSCLLIELGPICNCHRTKNSCERTLEFDN